MLQNTFTQKEVIPSQDEDSSAIPPMQLTRSGTLMLTIQHALTQHVHVVLCDSVREGEDLSNQLGDAHLVHTQVGVGRDDCAATEVNTLA